MLKIAWYVDLYVVVRFSQVSLLCLTHMRSS